MQNLPPSAVRDYLRVADPPPLLLDVREPWEYALVHLPDSVLLPLRQIGQADPRFDKNQEIVVVCHHGVRSMYAARFLESIGFTRIINLRGGIDAWARELDPHMTIY